MVAVQYHHVSGWVTISDDDLCSDCHELIYRPGDESFCCMSDRSNKWPGLFNEDGYCTSCVDHASCKPGENLAGPMGSLL